jgi:protein involved in polysaccharide export with SLBB domain
MISPKSAILKQTSSGKSMEAGEGRSALCPRSLAWPGLFWLLAGCALCRPGVDCALLADKGLAARSQNVAEAYRVNCPDVLDITVDSHSDLNGQREIGPDGRIHLATAGRLYVEGHTISEVAQLLAPVYGVPLASVHVRVAQYKSQQLYLIGQVAGLQRVVPYQGPETVVDLLHRVGGITPGAAPNNVQVVRPHIGEGERPEVFHVDLRAILLEHDVRSNIYLRAQDQIYVGETRQCAIVKYIPPWLRPMYETLWGMRRPAANSPDVPKT